MTIELFSVASKRIKTQALESAYNSGFCGCHLPSEDTPEGVEAQKAKDQFRSTAGINGYRFADSADDPLGSAGYNGIEGCHVYTGHAFEQRRKYNEGYPDTLFKMLQNSGCCVGASGKEGFDALLGVQSADESNVYRMYADSSMVTYSYRSGCGSGWYMGAHASMAIEHGWLPATVFDGRKLGELTVPDMDGLQADDESEFERLATSVWCRGRVPDNIERWMASNFMFESGAITELDTSSLESIMRVGELKGVMHHGSNYTAGRGGMDSVSRIGGHAQTCYGVDASDQAIDFFKQRGLKISTSNPVLPQGQTWGSGWSGEVDDDNWPFGTDDRGTVYTWADILRANTDPRKLQDIVSAVEEAGGWGWGPKHEGAWLVLLDTYQRYFAPECYVYLPKFQGIPGPDVPPTPPPIQEHPEITGTIYGEQNDAGGISIRGIPRLKLDGGEAAGNYDYLIEPIPGQSGQYRLTPKIV